ARRELQRQNKILQENLRLRELVDRISRHDLKSPLFVILGVPETLMEADNLLEDQKELLQLLSDSGRRMHEMITRSLDLIKMEQGTYEPKPVSVDVLKVIRQVFGELAKLINQKNLQWELFLDGEPVTDSAIVLVRGEEHLFHSLLSNVIKNAVEASPEGEKITVTLVSQPNFAVSVHNLGAIPLKIRDRFSERYVTSGKNRGTGLGVYSARLMAKTLGGDLSFTTHDTEGTTLTLSIPADREFLDNGNRDRLHKKLTEGA
ncbi:MAG: sensor histidine kinase, partial [Candidatus Rifleibacteriota bacterium]